MNAHTVLVIDDDLDIRDVIAQTLADEGIDVVTCGDGQMALDLLDQQRPGLILLDLMMPMMSGWEVLERLKTMHAVADVPVVLLSASRALEQTAQDAGVAGQLAKPFELDGLIGMVERHLTP